MIPLHNAPYNVLMMYHKELRKLLNIYMEKDPDRSGAIIIRRISKYWPLRHGPKQMLMIKELEEILEHIDKQMWKTGELAESRVFLYKMMSKIVGSEHFQVADHGLRLWQNKYLYDGCFNRHEFHEDIIKHVFHQLYFKSHQHWQNNDKLKKEGAEIVGCKVGDLSLKVLYGYKNANLKLYEVHKAAYTEKWEKGNKFRSNFFKEDDRWADIIQLAKANDEKEGRVLPEGYKGP